jgi:hypothetical protein
MQSTTPRILSFTLAALLAAASASVVAQSMSDPAPSAAPDATAPAGPDSNGDGKISLDEYKAQGGDEKSFAEMDANQDQSLSAEELSKAGSQS